MEITLEIAMKALTFLGVALAGALVSARHDSLRALAADAATGALGVALMFANARVGSDALGLVVDVCYLGLVGARIARRVRSRGLHAAPAGAEPERAAAPR